jgi:transcription antitermination factor NusG
MAHVVSTMSGLERTAADWLLTRLALQTYLPQVLVTRIQFGRKVETVEPLFRRYLFITNLYDEWRSVLETRGVLRFLSMGDAPFEIPDDELIAIRRHENSDGYISLDDYLPKLTVAGPVPFVRDQRLRVVDDDVFTGEIVYSTGLEIGNRCFVYFDMLGKAQRFEFAREQLADAPEPDADQDKRRRRKGHRAYRKGAGLSAVGEASPPA